MSDYDCCREQERCCLDRETYAIAIAISKKFNESPEAQLTMAYLYKAAGDYPSSNKIITKLEVDAKKQDLNINHLILSINTLRMSNFHDQRLFYEYKQEKQLLEKKLLNLTYEVSQPRIGFNLKELEEFEEFEKLQRAEKFESFKRFKNLNDKERTEPEIVQ